MYILILILKLDCVLHSRFLKCLLRHRSQKRIYIYIYICMHMMCKCMWMSAMYWAWIDGFKLSPLTIQISHLREILKSIRIKPRVSRVSPGMESLAVSSNFPLWFYNMPRMHVCVTARFTTHERLRGLQNNYN